MYAVDGLNGYNVADRIYTGNVDVTYIAGASSGASVATTVTWTEPVPTPYGVYPSPVEDSRIYFTSKTTTSFVMTVVPGLGTATLAGGVVPCMIIA
jgi:hypothetical protein